MTWFDYFSLNIGAMVVVMIITRKEWLRFRVHERLVLFVVGALIFYPAYIITFILEKTKVIKL